MKIVMALDSFKGCMSSREANEAAAEGARAVCPDAEIVLVPVSDGGEGFTEAFHAAVGGRLIEMAVKDPMMRTVRGCYLLHGDMAVIEVAQACGLSLLTAEERNPLVATSYGVVTLASDVKNPLCGENGAAHVFAPQKGATPEMVVQLDERARRFAEVSARHFGFDRSAEEGAGAAGGLGYAFLQYMNAACRSGISLLLDTIHFEVTVRGARLIVTGEGSADRQTLMGKLPMGILQKADGVPTCLIAGKISDREVLLEAGFAFAECINPPGLPLEEALRTEVARGNISQTVARILRQFKENN